MRKHATTVALVVAALGLGAYVALDWGKQTTTEAEARKHDLLPAWRPDDVERVDLEIMGHAAKLVRGVADDKGNRAWTVQLGAATVPGDAATIDQLLQSLEDARVGRKIEGSSVDRKAFGLDAPRAKLTIAMGKLVYSVAVGDDLPKPQRGVYAETERGVFVVSPELVSVLAARIDTYRDKAILPYFLDDSERITIAGEGEPAVLVRATWRTSRGPGFRFEGGPRVAGPALEKLGRALGELTAAAFLDDADADRALAKRLVLTLSPKDPKRGKTTLEIGGDCPGKEGYFVVVRRAPERLSACVAKAVVERLDVPRDALIDHRLFDAPADAVSEVLVTIGDEKIDLARRGSGWHERAPHDREVGADQAKGVLEALLDGDGELLTGEAAAAITKDLASAGLDKPREAMRLVSVAEGVGDAGAGEREEKVELGESKLGFVARRLEDGALLKLTPEVAEALRVGELALRPRRLFTADLKEVKSLRVDRRGTTQRFSHDAAGVFHLVEPKIEGLGADNGLATDLASELGRLTAESFVAEQATAAHGLDKPRMTATLELESKKLVVELGAATSRGTFARVAGEPTVFLASQTLVDALDRWLLDRAALLFDAPDLDRVALSTRGGKKLAVEQKDGVLRVVGAQDPDGAHAALVREGVTNLIAEAVVTVGKPDKLEGFGEPALEIELVRRADKSPIAIVVGASDMRGGILVRYVRKKGIDATFAIAQSKLRPLFEAAGEDTK